MGPKKVTAISLYMRDLRTENNKRFMDNKSAAQMFRQLGVKEKDYYEVQAKKMNEKIEDTVFTTQKDTTGFLLSEVTEIDQRRAAWNKKASEIIDGIASSENVFRREFVVAYVSGTHFNRGEDNVDLFSPGEICLIKFSLADGISRMMTLFPEPIDVAAGYRQTLFEDMEENVGWLPDTFRDNQPLEYCISEMKSFIGSDCIFVPTKDHQYNVGLALCSIFGERNRRCPWIESVQDWGKYCLIYQLEHLLAAIMKLNSVVEDASVSVLLDCWIRTNMDIASECCLRHQNYGLANQCASNVLRKKIYASFFVMRSIFPDKMKDVRKLVSELFYNNLEYAMTLDDRRNGDNVESSENRELTRANWSDYFCSKEDIINIITALDGITIEDRNETKGKSLNKSEPGCGRGQRMRRNQLTTIPGDAINKLKLPTVIC